MQTRHPGDTAPSTVVTVLLLGVWILATPFFLQMAFLSSMELFGEQPSAAQMTETRWWFATAIVSGIGAPGLGLRLSLRGGGWRVWLFGAALGVAVVALLGGAAFTFA